MLKDVGERVGEHLKVGKRACAADVVHQRSVGAWSEVGEDKGMVVRVLSAVENRMDRASESTVCALRNESNLRITL